MSALSSLDISNSLRAAGLKEGAVVLVTSRLFTLGQVAVEVPHSDEKLGQLWTYLDAIETVIGKEGTIVVSTSFEDYARYSTPFIREESPSRSGVFSEFVRTLPGTIRSTHPIMSLAARGGRAMEICGRPHLDAFGARSAWATLHQMNATMLMLGLGVSGGGVFVHYLEQLYGVPYQYNKVYDTPVYANREQLLGPFTMNVRYLDFSIQNTYEHVEKCLLETSLVRKFPLGRGYFCMSDANSLLNGVFDLLDRDRYALLVTPPLFRKGTIPFDGNTGKLKTVYTSPDRDFE